MPRSTPPRTRLYVDAELSASRLPLAAPEAHYLGHVLRLRANDELVVFNGRGHERRAAVMRLERHRAELELAEVLEPIPEPPVAVTLLQALVKSDAMDTIVQKATELGVAGLVAFRSEHSVVKLDAERADRRLSHWTRIAQSACEQSGRHRPPAIRLAADFAAVLDELPERSGRIAFVPGAAALARGATAHARVCLLLGPEGGLSAADLELADAAGFVRASLGPRVLRADTAAMAACTLAQHLWGDLCASP